MKFILSCTRCTGEVAENCCVAENSKHHKKKIALHSFFSFLFALPNLFRREEFSLITKRTTDTKKCRHTKAACLRFFSGCTVFLQWLQPVAGAVFFVAIGSSCISSLVLAADESQTATFTTHIAPFLKTHCSKCHGAKKQNGERRFDTLPTAIDNSNTLADYQDILDQLNLGEMPPADELQPAAKHRRLVVEWLTKNVAAYHASRDDTGGETILRRLNAREYRNTIRDLFGMNMVMFDPTEGFPRDQTIDHLDNMGDALVTSGYLLQKYLAAADSVVDKAVYPLQQPQAQKWVFNDSFNQQPEIDQVHRTTNKFKHMTLYDVPGADKPEGAYGPIHAFKQGVPFDGFYQIRLRAEALNRDHPYDDDFIGTDRTQPLRLGIVPGDHMVGSLHLPQPIQPLLAEIDLADEVKWYTVRVWLDAGYTPRFIFRNGLMDARNLWGKLAKKYADQFPKLKKGGIVEHRFNSIKYGKLPQIHIYEIEIAGPFYDEWPTPAQQAVFGQAADDILKSSQITDSQLRHQLRRFASRAYRRPVTDDDVERLMAVVQRQQAAGRSRLEAYTDALKTVLCSPAFLYLEEPTADGVSATTLASRLSYFLWSSSPDEELLTLSKSGELLQPSVLQQQIDRMLDDSRSDAFVEGFLGSWLTLREFGSSPPDRDQFTSFYRFGLAEAMLEETRLFTRHMLNQNLSVGNFLDSDFTFLNKPLAQHYGMVAPSGDGFEFQKVALTDRRRGGLLGQASVLTVTANGIDTSPVVRGVWVLENILGTPPSPPPPDIEPLDPDVRGAKSIRDQLEKHRSIASCNDCHRRIDPMGFALENFDPIGRWRTSYGKKVKIDASSQMPNGKTFDDIVGFKKILQEQQQQQLFIRSLTSKLLAYAIGRQMTPADRPHIDRITAELATKDNGFRDLIRLVVSSELFRT